MPSTLIPAPRTPLFDKATGNLTREWYLFFYNLFRLVLSGGNDISVADLLILPPMDPGAVSAEIKNAQQAQILIDSGVREQVAQIIKELNSLKLIASEQRLSSEILKDLNSLKLMPMEQRVSTEILKRISALETSPPPAPLDTVVNRTGDTMSGSLGVAGLTVNADVLRVTTSKTPATAASTGTVGQIAWDTNYVYVCVATDTWKRTAISTW